MPKRSSLPKDKGRERPSRSATRTGATYTIGIDLGGTKVAAALVSENGGILSEARMPTVPPWLKDLDPKLATRASRASDVRKHVEYVIAAMAESAWTVSEPLRAKKLTGRLVGIGLASAGPMNIEKGTLDYPSNFVGWKKVQLVRRLESALARRGLKTRLHFQNDAMAAALGEGWMGWATRCQTYAVITIGTGIGTGVIFNGRPAQSKGMGSEWGHILANSTGISSHTLYQSTVEGLSSGTGLIRRANARGFRGQSVSDLACAAQTGDQLALQVFREASEGLASLFYALSLGFHPELFVVTGGMLAIRKFFLPQAITLYREIVKSKYPDFLTPVKISRLGNKAGVIGSARLPRLLGP